MRRLLTLAAVGVLAAVLPTALAGAYTPGPEAGLAVGISSLTGGAAVGAASEAKGSLAVHSATPSPRLTDGFRGIRLASGRGYTLHQPTARVTASVAPLVIVLHGLHNTWQDMEVWGDWAQYADDHGFVVAYGIGIGASWNAGGCCGSAHHLGTDDVGYLVSVVGDVAARYPIDRDRVYLAGFSDGDMMAMRAECDRPDVFAAAGGSSGALVGGCRAPAGQIRVRHLHGRDDLVVPYRGGYSAYTRTSFRPVAALRRMIAAGSPRPQVAVTTLPCGHTWPQQDNVCRVNGTDLIWRWISQFSRSGAGASRHPRSPHAPS